MAHLGLYLDPQSHDIGLDATNNLHLCNDAQAVGQHLKQRLMTYEGEWFIDETVGVPWFQYVFVRPVDIDTSEAVIKAEAIETDGVEALTAFSMIPGLNAREYAVSIEAQTEYDDIATVNL